MSIHMNLSEIVKGLIARLVTKIVLTILTMMKIMSPAFMAGTYGRLTGTPAGSQHLRAEHLRARSDQTDYQYGG